MIEGEDKIIENLRLEESARRRRIACHGSDNPTLSVSTTRPQQ